MRITFRAAIALIACKAAKSILRLAGRGGTSLPGKVALKLCPDILARLSSGVDTVLVTGTNGKTTTCRMIEECFLRSGSPALANRSGANLLHGVVTAFADNRTVTGRLKLSHAVIECDEAAFTQVTRYVDARAAVVTNVFRDQLDRFGEISYTVGRIAEGFSNLKNAALCVNADCPLCVSTADSANGKRVIWYGVDGEPLPEPASIPVSDVPHCVRCGAGYKYGYVSYGHLGGFFCPDCGDRRPEPEIRVGAILDETSDHTDISVGEGENARTIRINLPGRYNVYNAAAALAAAEAMGLDRDAVAEALAQFECGFGRLERVALGAADLRMILVKNPAGLNQALSVAAAGAEGAALCLILNDNTADGTDVSWIWDADFERMADLPFLRVYVSGIRAEDLALRLKYAGVGGAVMEKDYEKLLDELQGFGGRVFVLPTYTAMLDFRARLQKRTELRDFWE